MITEQQIAYYNQLSPQKQHILKIMSQLGTFYNEKEVTEQISVKTAVTQKIVKQCIIEAEEHGILKYSEGDAYYLRFHEVTIPFLLFITPQLSNFNRERKNIDQKYFGYWSFYSTSVVRIIAKFLYCLLYDREDLSKTENLLLKSENGYHFSQLCELLDDPVYRSKISFLDTNLLLKLFNCRNNTFIDKLQPIAQMGSLWSEVASCLPDNVQVSNPLENFIDFHSARFSPEKSSEDNAFYPLYCSAIKSLIAGEIKVAISFFNKGLKLERQFHTGIPFPRNENYAVYYFAAVLSSAPEASIAQCKKILAKMENRYYTSLEGVFKMVIYNALNEKEKKEHAATELFMSQMYRDSDMGALLIIIFLFMADNIPPEQELLYMSGITEKAFRSGYVALAYEAAFALKNWYGTPQTRELFREIAEKTDYAPVVSRIERHEAWEKSLNLLLGLSSPKRSKSNKEKEAASRIIYLINPASLEIQPVLQTRTAKGLWSGGRNIALKTFFEGNVPGMTEQDLRISKTLTKKEGYYYGTSPYFFTDRTMVELIGHPCLFLKGGEDIPIEFVAAQPEVTVTHTSRGYTLKSNIKEVGNEIFLVKETNTRYKVYELTQTQKELINILSIHHITIPEKGKKKLSEVLGSISRFAAVHSDLLTDETGDSGIETVKADNRIRVQLLPFGEGLKAELFSKPFGNHPPYCKPGKGGKMLFANENGKRLQTERDMKGEKEYADILFNEIQALENVDTNHELIAFDHPLDSLNLLDVVADHKDICVVEWPEGERFTLRGKVNVRQLSLNIKSKTDWFELTGALQIDEKTVIDLQQLMILSGKSYGRFIELSEGEFIALGNELKKRLEAFGAFAENGKNGLRINRFASLAIGDYLDDAENLKADKKWKAFRRTISAKGVSVASVPASLQAELRPYQEEGFRWMARLGEWESGACLADDMGLGKTVQALAVLLHRRSAGSALVVCPVSVIGNWIAEINRFAPSLNIKIPGSGNREELLQSLEAGDVLITSYGLLQSEEELFAKTTFATVVLDEAHVIKNRTTKTSKAIMRLKASFRIALTGTPLQNNLGELWNIFNFLNPGLLGGIQHFSDTFVKPDSESARKHLKKLISPFILRRTKSAVLDELPPKTEIVKKVQLSPREMAFYEALRRQALINVAESQNGAGAKHLQVLAEITRLRQASCHPALVNAELNIPSSKLNLFLETVDELRESRHRALVFSQFVSHLQLIRQALDERNISYQYLDGSTPAAERERRVKSFQNGDGDLFLISLKAGGLGLNLTAADYVIHMDPWWNPAIEDQASDRTHRIGQTRPVTIYRLIAENTIEEKIINLHHTKRDLAQQLLDGSDQAAHFSFEELVALIRVG